MRSGGVALLWGPPRSGTTWLFNVVRHMLEHGDMGYQTWVFGHRAPRPIKGLPLLVKSHQAHSLDELVGLSETGNVNLATIFRDPHVTFQSLLRTQSVHGDELVSWLSRDIESLREALDVLPVGVVIREEWIEERAPEVIAALGALLDIPLSDTAAQATADRYSRENVRRSISDLARSRGWAHSFDHYDRESHWHANHIAPPDHPVEDITDDQRAELDRLSLIVDELTENHGILNTEPLPVTKRNRPVAHDLLRSQRWASRPRWRSTLLLGRK